MRVMQDGGVGDTSTYAALFAAATSLATLMVTTVINGRREQRRWAREALTEAFVRFLEASWSYSDTVRDWPPDQTLDPQALSDRSAVLRTELTRLRLLASDGVLQAGQELMRCHKALLQAGTERREQALEATSTARRRVVAAAKREMGL